MPFAAGAMFSLNRWCKHESCTYAERDEIYDLKNRLVELLYRAGYCTEAWEHRTILPAKICWDCGGDGCDRCDYTGEYLSAKTLIFVCFRFRIAGFTYSWHQPAHLVTFPVHLDREPQAWTLAALEKPVPLDRRGFYQAKALIRWVLKQDLGKVGEGEEKAN